MGVEIGTKDEKRNDQESKLLMCSGNNSLSEHNSLCSEIAKHSVFGIF